MFEIPFVGFKCKISKTSLAQGMIGLLSMCVRNHFITCLKKLTSKANIYMLVHIIKELNALISIYVQQRSATHKQNLERLS